jgi:hypothetical protein
MADALSLRAPEFGGKSVIRFVGKIACETALIGITQYDRSAALLGVLTIWTASTAGPSEASQYWGESEAIVLRGTGCNATAYAPVPGTANLLVGRQLFERNGTPVTVDAGCRNHPDAVVNNHRTGLVSDQLDWAQKEFTVVRPLLATPAEIIADPMKGLWRSNPRANPVTAISDRSVDGTGDDIRFFLRRTRRWKD